MNKKLTVQLSIGRLLALVAIVGLALGVSFYAASPGMAGQTASQIPAPDVPSADPPAGGPGFISVPSFFFTGYPTNLPYTFQGPGLFNPDAASKSFIAGVMLPHGASVTKLVAFYYDTHATHNLTLRLFKSNWDSVVSDIMAEVTSSGSSGAIRAMEDSTISAHLVNNQGMYYYLMVDLPPSLDVALMSVRIDYAYNVSAALIKK
ncbi:MAG: hypothetical protein JXB15_13985 [Anaerolineales bacterium]|nr:hypothetical protein [Anaerolineales bacterium]